MTEPSDMRSFWDEKAADNPLWYVHSGLEFDAPDEREFWRSGEEEVVNALAAAGISGGDLAIDIGVGAARLTRALASRFASVRSFDVSPGMIEVARANLERAGVANVELTAVAGDGSLPVESGTADLVLSLQVFQHIPSRLATLAYIRESGRALKPGGKAVFQLRSCLRSDPILGSLELALRAVVERARRLRNPPPPNLDSPAWQGRRVGVWQIRRAARAAGMRVNETRWISKRGASLFVVCAKDR